MPASSYDLIVIGGGPGGYVAAIRASQLELKTAVVERAKLGGRCLNEACIPAKAVLRVADVWTEVGQARQLGIRVDGAKVEWPAVAKRRDRVIKTIGSGVAGLLRKHAIDVVEGAGSLIPGGGVKVHGGTERELGAAKVILATGSVPQSIPGVELGGRVIGTAETWLTNERPERLVVVGAGASGTEVASAFGRLGTGVVLVEMLDRVLPGEDEEVSALVAGELSKQNVEVLTGTTVEEVNASPAGVEVRAGGEVVACDFLCVAGGRAPDIHALGLAEAGVSTDQHGRVEVDARMRTSGEGIYAIGDLVRGPALAHKASDEGVIAAEDAAGLDTHPLAYDDIPRVTFCYPQVASMGLTEAQARERVDDPANLRVGRFPFGAAGAATVYGDRGGLIKVVGDTRYGEILGAHIVGARATELLAEVSVARALEGTYADLARIVHAHPTFSEAVMEAARDAAGWVIHG